ncbi:MAG: FapA family protein [Gammaproteobacteria bacterium]|nr:FapA family protein [Gammaproteobacteria bacterium]MBU1555732.1 FapA family protein [Gammaproteobacteria bacterium]MBU2069845.1 FapA family protein [Gammaproteobacteria bacterium]MBU2184873.1 FapA family protein [Gammaproteobacteria bacterium]MBU2204409.1 FapA family protein [Gammaproteobacteria bacterium]
MQFTEQNNSIKITVPVTLDALNANDLNSAIQQAGYSRCLVIQEQLTNLLVEYQQIQQKIKEQLKPLGTPLTYRIAEKKDAELAFEIAEDHSSAAAVITAAWGGAPVSANSLVKGAQEAGVVFGFSKDHIIKLVSHASKAEPGSRVKLIIAKGRPVKNGENSRFEAMMAEMQSRRNRPVVQSDDKADLRDFGVIPSVKTGEALVRRHPPTPGIDGMTVTGTLLPAVPGQVIEWSLGEGVELAAQDPDLLLAARDGLPRMIEHGATVDEVFTVKNVDLATGHIIFKGSVVVNGDVTEGMKVVAGGNVFVKGFVEGTLIDAGGDITVGGSIIGHQLASAEKDSSYSTTLQAKGDIQCNLAQYARFVTDGNLYINKQIMHCAVAAAKVYAGPEDNPNGKVIGGYFYLDYGIHTGNLGAPSSSNVLIELNRMIDPIAEKQDVLRSSITAAKKDMQDIREQLDKLKKIEGNAQIDARRQELTADFEEHKSVALALINDVKQLEAQRQQKLAETVIVARQQLYSAVEVHFGTDQIRSRREYGPSKILLVDGSPAIEAFF